MTEDRSAASRSACAAWEATRSDSYDLEAQLLPEQIRRNLAQASVAITADRLLRASIVDRLREMGVDDAAEAGPVPVPDLHDAPLDDALAELTANGVLSDADIFAVRGLRQYVVTLAARMPDAILGDGVLVRPDLVEAAVPVLRKINLFWGRMNIDANPAFDGQDVADDDMVDGMTALLELLVASAAAA